MGNCCAGRLKNLSIVEIFFYLSDDEKFISYLETYYFPKKSEGKIDYSKINDHINLIGDTLLHYAVFNNRNKLCKYLIESGADFKFENDRSRTPFDLAKNKNEIQMLMK